MIFLNKKGCFLSLQGKKHSLQRFFPHFRTGNEQKVVKKPDFQSICKLKYHCKEVFGYCKDVFLLFSSLLVSLTTKLSESYRPIVVDLRGHGYSTNHENKFTHREAASDVFPMLGKLGVGHFSAMGI
jgi:hypothetical protein